MSNKFSIKVTVVDSSYGNIGNLTTEILYSIISTTNGKSSDKVTGLKYTYYGYSNDKIQDTNISNILVNENNYWLATRSVNSYSDDYAGFVLHYVENKKIIGGNICMGAGTYLSPIPIDYPVRPVVTLKSNIIDVDAGYNETTGWSLK